MNRLQILIESEISKAMMLLEGDVDDTERFIARVRIRTYRDILKTMEIIRDEENRQAATR